MLITVAYTPLDSPGGVPKFNRDLHAAFPGGKHFSWWDVCKEFNANPDSQTLTEWDKAKALNRWLIASRRISKEDFIVADSFWADGLEGFPRAVSHQHGNWSHTTAQDTAAGIPPEFPFHAAVQLAFRRKWAAAGRAMTCASDFLAQEMVEQWNIGATVINNGIDIFDWYPRPKGVFQNKRPLIIHGVTNANKGFDHVRAVQNGVNADVLLLDEAAQKLQRMFPDVTYPKQTALSQADAVIVPSAYEGFGFFLLEALACGVPVFAYDVGLARKIRQDGLQNVVGAVYERSLRKPNTTAEAVSVLIQRIQTGDRTLNPRKVAMQYGMDRFNRDWREFFQNSFGATP